MKKSILRISLWGLVSSALFSCSKSDNVSISKPLTVIGEPISDTIIAGGAIKGTLLSGKTYHVTKDVTINAGDTLYVQPGVKVVVEGDGNANTSPMFIVKGSIISDGTQENPIWFTTPDSYTKSSSTDLTNASTDPAYKGNWGGFQGDTSCRLMVFRWTHVEYTGAPYGDNNVIWDAKSDDATPAFYMNPSPEGAYGKFIFEDSWLFGVKDDGIGKLQHTYVNIMRNTFNKVGAKGGEAVNLKNDVYGNMAYNFCYGIATNGLKTASIAGQSSIVNIYNNTLVNCGFRQAKATRNGSINTETNAGGYIYNNIIVNCKQGLRITFSSEKGKPSDTLNTSYGNNLTFIGRSESLDGSVYMMYIEPNQFTLKQATDINGYVNGTILANGTNDGTNNIDTTKYNPYFSNYNSVAMSLDNKYLYSVIPSGANFHLAANSPAIGAGVYAGGTGTHAIPTKPTAALLTQYGFPMNLAALSGLASITAPNKDLGAFPTDGTGNQHTY